MGASIHLYARQKRGIDPVVGCHRFSTHLDINSLAYQFRNLVFARVPLPPVPHSVVGCIVEGHGAGVAMKDRNDFGLSSSFSLSLWERVRVRVNHSPIKLGTGSETKADKLLVAASQARHTATRSAATLGRNALRVRFRQLCNKFATT